MDHGLGIPVALIWAGVYPGHSSRLESGLFFDHFLRLGRTSSIEIRFLGPNPSVGSSPNNAGRLSGPFAEHIQLERPVNEFVMPAVEIEADEGPCAEHIPVTDLGKSATGTRVRREVCVEDGRATGKVENAPSVFIDAPHEDGVARRRPAFTLVAERLKDPGVTMFNRREPLPALGRGGVHNEAAPVTKTPGHRRKTTGVLLT